MINSLLLILISPWYLQPPQTQVLHPGEQVVHVRLLDSRDGKPIRAASVGLFTDSGQLVWSAETDGEGRSQVVLGAEAKSVVWDAKQPKGWSMARCDVVLKDRYKPWPQPEYMVTTLLKNGVAAQDRCSHRVALARPGELVVFARPFAWWEKMAASALD